MSEAEEQNNKQHKDTAGPTRSFDGSVAGPGSQIGHFRIEQELGHGGMGVVYLGRDTTLGRSVAIKSLPPEVMADRRICSRLEREARLLASLSHPNIAAIYEELEEAEGATYLILEYVPGRTLAKRIAAGPLTLEEVLSIASQTAAALAAAHEHGIVHRDLKPGNIKITPEGNVKVLDFGLAKAIEEAETRGQQSTVTQPGRVIGTPAYMSPEQAVGDPVDYRTDIWSLGVVIYEMLTGELPFQGNTHQALTHCILHDQPKRLTRMRRDTPMNLERIFSEMLRKDPHGRPEGMKAVIKELGDIRRESVMTATASKRPPSIAILPFVDMSPGRDQEYFCDGMAEELINALTQIKDLRVIARTSAFSYKGKDVNVREIGRELDVATVLEGSVRKARNRLRITAQLVDTAGGHHLWSQRYDRDMGDVFAIQDEITLAIVETLEPKLLGQEEASLAKRQTVDLEVYNLYLRGLYFQNKRSEMDLKKAVGHFELAIEKDPDYALAYTGLASCYGLLPFYSPALARESAPKAREMALRATEIDDMLAEAHASLGFIKSWYDWDWEGAESEFTRAIELNPGYASAHHWYSYTLMYRARFNEAIKEIEQALELDPVSVAINKDLGTVRLYAGQLDRAIEPSKKAIEMDPSIMYAHLHVGMAYVAKSMYEEALIEFQKEREISKGAHAWTELYIGWAYIEMGKPDETQEVLDNLLERATSEYVSPFILASFYVVLGKDDRGFELLNKAYEQQDEWLCFLRIHPVLDRIRSDPKYTLLLKKMNLEG